MPFGLVDELSVTSLIRLRKTGPSIRIRCKQSYIRRVEAIVKKRPNDQTYGFYNERTCGF